MTRSPSPPPGSSSPATAPAEHDPWAPVRATALADAHAQAERLLAEAHERAAATVAAAGERATVLREETLAGAREAADADARRVLAGARASAHELLLSVRREVYATVTRDVARQAASRREDYLALTALLVEDARRRLGANVEIADAPGGGIIARAPGRQLDYSLSTRVRRCLARLDDEVAALWS